MTFQPLSATSPSRARASRIGDVVRHRLFDFRGVVFDVDPEFANSEEWYEAIPEAMRPSKDQPFYHLLAENAETSYVAYVSQQNLVPDDSDGADRPPGDRRPCSSASRAAATAPAEPPPLARQVDTEGPLP